MVSELDPDLGSYLEHSSSIMPIYGIILRLLLLLGHIYGEMRLHQCN